VQKKREKRKTGDSLDRTEESTTIEGAIVMIQGGKKWEKRE